MSDDTLAAGAAAAENPAAGADAGAAAAAADAAKTGGDKGTGGAGGDEAAKAAAEAAKAAGDDAGGQGEQDGPWGKDWREKIAKGDEKKLGLLKRFASPEAMAEAYDAAQRKISEGIKPKGKPGPKATDEEWSAYRKEAGIPDTVDDFVKAIELPDKRVIGDDDKPIVAAFSERAIKAGIAPGDMAQMVDEYYAIQEEVAAQQATADADFKREATKQLKEEWGGDFDANFAAMRPYFEGVDETLFDNLMGGRLADGSKIGNHPGLLKFFVNKAVAENPMATILPSSDTSMESLEAEISKIEKRMGEDRDGYFKDEKAQERYRKLTATRDKVKGGK